MLTAPTEVPPKAPPVAKADAPLRTDIPPPETIVFDNKYGKSTFTHKLHYERVNGDCTVCHNKIFPQSRAPINYGKAQHRVAEAEGTACALLPSRGGNVVRSRQPLREVPRVEVLKPFSLRFVAEDDRFFPMRSGLLCVVSVLIFAALPSSPRMGNIGAWKPTAAWALFRAPSSKTRRIAIRRAGASAATSIPLAWSVSTPMGRRVTAWTFPQPTSKGTPPTQIRPLPTRGTRLSTASWPPSTSTSWLGHASASEWASAPA